MRQKKAAAKALPFSIPVLSLSLENLCHYIIPLPYLHYLLFLLSCYALLPTSSTAPVPL